MKKVDVLKMKSLSERLNKASVQLTQNLEKIAILIDNDKVDEYVKLISENEELIKEISEIKRNLITKESSSQQEKDQLLNEIELLSENSRNLNQLNINKMTEKVNQKSEENLMVSQKVHASQVYNDMQYND